MGIPRKYLVMLAVLAMQTCLGGIYAWSEFAGRLQAEHGLAAAQTSYIFGLCIQVFTIGAIVTGRLSDKWGPRPLAAAGGVLLGMAYLLAGYSGGQYWLLLVGAGVVQGLAIACGYATAIATVVRWFPYHKGLATGLAVAGYGLGAGVLGAVIEAFHAYGWDVLKIFRAVGLLYGGVCLVAGLTMADPPRAISHEHPPFIGYRRLLGDRRFWALALAMFGLTMPGLIIVPNLLQIGTNFGFGSQVAAWSISAFAVGNAAGRLVWGRAYDRLGGARALPLSMAGILVSVLVLLGSDHVPAEGYWIVYLIGVAMVSFCYGSCFAIYAPRVAELYSPAVVGTIYPLILAAHGIGAVIAGWWIDQTNATANGFRPAIWIGLGFAAVAMAGYLLLSRGTRARPTHIDLPDRIDADTP